MKTLYYFPKSGKNFHHSIGIADFSRELVALGVKSAIINSIRFLITSHIFQLFPSGWL